MITGLTAVASSTEVLAGAAGFEDKPVVRIAMACRRPPVPDSCVRRFRNVNNNSALLLQMVIDIITVQSRSLLNWSILQIYLCIELHCQTANSPLTTKRSLRSVIMDELRHGFSRDDNPACKHGEEEEGRL